MITAVSSSAWPKPVCHGLKSTPRHRSIASTDAKPKARLLRCPATKTSRTRPLIRRTRRAINRENSIRSATSADTPPSFIETFTPARCQWVFARWAAMPGVGGSNQVRTTILPLALFSSVQRCARGCRTAGRHPRRHAKSNLFAARRRPVRVPRDRRRSPSRPARRARSTRRAWPRSRAQYFEPATRAEVGAMLSADPDTLTAHDIASGETWADRYRDSDRGGSRQRYEQTRQWHFVNIELDGPNLDRACFGHPRLPAALPASSGPAKACLVDKIEQFTAELGNSATGSGERLLALKFLLHLIGDVHQPLHAADSHDAGANRKQVTAAGFGAGNLHHFWDVEFVERL